MERLEALVDRLGQGLLERDAAVRLVLLAALAGEHVLLIGPPGTAKSELARRLHRCLEGAPYFERLLTRFSTPEELFGPLSLKALEDDRYERLTAGFMPEAGVAFLDEVFKANSAILNALLTLLNEREFDNGSGRVRTPLVSVIGASNELPADESLLAFFDRFLLRVPVAPVSDDAFAALLRLEGGRPAAVADHITAAERGAITAAAAGVELGDDAVAGMVALRAHLAEGGRVLSDRRWRQWTALLKVAAACEGRPRVDALDLWLAPYVAASSPDDAPELERWFEQEWMQAVPRQAPWLTRAVEAFEKQLEVEQAMPADDGDDAAGKLALAKAIGFGQDRDSEGGMLRIVSRQLEEQLRRRWSPVHVQARLAQLEEILGHVREHHQAAAAEEAALRTRLAARLWMPPAQRARMISAHEATRAVLEGLHARLLAARQGFAALPLDDTLDTAAPPPVALEPEDA
jgi:MoxR-like ATPase